MKQNLYNEIHNRYLGRIVNKKNLYFAKKKKEY